MINLLLLVNALLRHGPGLVVHNLARHLDSRRYCITVVALDEVDATLSSTLRDEGIAVIQLPLGKNPFLALAETIRVRKVDVLHTHGLRADLIGRIVGKTMSLSVTLSTVHDAPSMYRHALGPLRGELALLAQVLTGNLADVVVMVADATKTAYCQAWPRLVSAKSYCTIHNGVPDCYLAPTHARTEPTSKGLTIGTIARLTARKGITYLVDAASCLLTTWPQLRFVLVGEGEATAELQRRVHQRGLGSSFSFLGCRDDIPELLRDMDVFVLPSLDECLPLAILEAMSAGKAIIASDVGGVREAIVQEQSGILVPPADTRALVTALNRVIGDPQMRERLGIAARDRYLRLFAVDAMVGQYAALYERMLARKRRSESQSTDDCVVSRGKPSVQRS